MDIPNKIGSHAIVEKALIDETCLHTKNCTHRINGKVLGKADWSAISRNEATYYLFFGYQNGEITDSCHESLEDAKEQAEFEYDGISEKWLTT